MTEHQCVACQRRPYDRAQVCQPCRRGLDGLLVDVLDLWVQLPDELVPGASGGEHVSGSREAPLPLRVDVLDLVLPANLGSREPMTRGVLGLDPDQVGDLSVATELHTWARDWAQERTERAPEPYVASMVTWLRLRVEWACDAHPAVDEFAAGMRDLAGRMRGVLGQAPERPVLLGVPCPGCDMVATYRQPGDERTHCGACGRIFEPDVYERMMAAKVADLRGVA